MYGENFYGGNGIVGAQVNVINNFPKLSLQSMQTDFQPLKTS